MYQTESATEDTKTKMQFVISEMSFVRDTDVKKELSFWEGGAIILTQLISTTEAPRKELCHDPWPSYRRNCD